MSDYFPIGMVKDILLIRPFTYFKVIIDPVDFRMVMFYTAIFFAVALRYLAFKQLLPTWISGNIYIFSFFIILAGSLLSIFLRHRSLSNLPSKFGEHFHFIIGLSLKIFIILYILVRLSFGEIIVNGITLFKINATQILALVEIAVVAATIFALRWYNTERRYVSGSWSPRRL